MWPSPQKHGPKAPTCTHVPAPFHFTSLLVDGGYGGELAVTWVQVGTFIAPPMYNKKNKEIAKCKQIEGIAYSTLSWEMIVRENEDWLWYKLYIWLGHTSGVAISCCTANWPTVTEMVGAAAAVGAGVSDNRKWGRSYSSYESTVLVAWDNNRNLEQIKSFNNQIHVLNEKLNSHMTLISSNICMIRNNWKVIDWKLTYIRRTGKTQIIIFILVLIIIVITTCMFIFK